MPKRLNITTRQRDEVFKLYARGASPKEIVATHPEFGLTAKQVRTMALKGRWAQRKAELIEIRRQSAAEVLSQVRQESTDDFRTFLDDSGESIKEDTKKLKTGWKFVANAADVSSLLRGKKLLQERAFEFYLGGSELRAPGLAIANVFIQAIPLQKLSVQEMAEHASEAANQDRDDSDDENLPRLSKP